MPTAVLIVWQLLLFAQDDEEYRRSDHSDGNRRNNDLQNAVILPILRTMICRLRGFAAGINARSFA